MRLPLSRIPVGWGYLLALGGAVGTSALLGAALWAKAASRPAVYLVAGNDDPKVVLPEVIPDALARDFARDFIVTLETYLPATVERNLAFLSGRIAPAGVSDFERFASNLKRLVRESRQASELVLHDPSAASVVRDGKRLEVILRGIRRLTVEGADLQEARLLYRVALVPGSPSRENPTGLVVGGFSVRTEAGEGARDP